MSDKHSYSYIRDHLRCALRILEDIDFMNKDDDIFFGFHNYGETGFIKNPRTGYMVGIQLDSFITYHALELRENEYSIIDKEYGVRGTTKEKIDKIIKKSKIYMEYGLDWIEMLGFTFPSEKENDDYDRYKQVYYLCKENYKKYGHKARYDDGDDLFRLLTYMLNTDDCYSDQHKFRFGVCTNDEPLLPPDSFHIIVKYKKYKYYIPFPSNFPMVKKKDFTKPIKFIY